LIKIITGVYSADSGTYLIDGEPVHSGSEPSALLKRGIHAIYQENDLVPFFTVSENVMLNNESLKGGVVLDRKAMETRTKEILSTLLRSDLDPRAYKKS